MRDFFIALTRDADQPRRLGHRHRQRADHRQPVHHGPGGPGRRAVHRHPRLPDPAGPVRPRPAAHPDRHRPESAGGPGGRRPAARRRRRFPVIDLNRARTRTPVLIFLVLTAVNVVVLATATYKGVEVMESTQFCGATCHTVMQPEYTAYQRSPHARVACVELPHRPRRRLVRQVQALRDLAGHRRHLRPLPATRSPRRSRTCARRARPASNATGRRSSSATG